MSELIYEQAFESCRKDLLENLDFTKNLEHFKACFNEIGEQDLECIFSMFSVDKSHVISESYVSNAIFSCLLCNSNERINRIASQKADEMIRGLS